MLQLGFSVILCLSAFVIPLVSLAQSVHKHEIHCSRERSRTAWNVIDEYLIPFVEQERYSLSQGCKLHPDNDMFRQQELKKDHITANQWQCTHCKKMFRTEKFLDQHFDKRHMDQINITADRCLADVCGALHCDYYNAMLQSKRKKTKCNTLASDKNLHLCQSLAKSCFPPDISSSSRRLHDFFLRQFCDAHECKKKVKPFARGNGRYGDRALHIALAVFVFLLLLLFYIGVYAHRCDLNKLHIKMKKIQKPEERRK